MTLFMSVMMRQGKRRMWPSLMQHIRAIVRGQICAGRFLIKFWNWCGGGNSFFFLCRISAGGFPSRHISVIKEVWRFPCIWLPGFIAVLLSKAVGKQLTCVFVDHGLLRKNEGDEVEAVFGPEGPYELNFIRVNAQERFYEKLAGVEEPEQKRKIIGEEFIRVFEEEAKKIGAVDFLVQGTIYPDVIESGLGKSAVIKSHHNVGGLPDYVDFKEIVEPLRLLFKDEVRKVGLELGIPEYLVFRQPFPGPGLGIRIIGEVTAEKVRIVQDADAIYREEIAKAGVDKRLGQYFAALTNMRSVGVMGDFRTYDYAVALRAVETSDFMTAEAAEIPWEVLQKVMNRIVNEVKGVNRVMYDLTSKPPGTIEFE